MDDTLTRARCLSCGGGLAFDEWSRGLKSCSRCRVSPPGSSASPAAVYVPGPRPAGLPQPARAGTGARPALHRRPNAGTHPADYERLLDDVPDSLIDEIVATLEAEAHRLEREQGASSSLAGVLEDIGFGKNPREYQFAAWGFALGFAANVVLAKAAQMQTSAPLSEFIAPLLVGGVVAGAACAAIGWGYAKLREP